MADPNSFARQNGDFQPQVGTRLQPSIQSAGFNFVAPQKSVDLDAALGALSQLEPTITAIAAKHVKDGEEKDTQAGREAALKEALDYGEAVRQGKLPANQSKWFMKGYKSQYGEVLGQQWALEAKTAWTQSDAKNSDKPDAANSFVTDFIKKKLESAPGMDPDVRAGLLPHLLQTRSTVIQAQTEWSAKQVMEKSLENIGTLITQDVDAYVKSGGKMPIQDLLASIKKRDGEGRLMGLDNDTLNRTVVQAVTAKAREMGSQSLLNVLKMYEHVGNNPKYLNDVRSASDAITSKAAAQESLAWTREQRVRHEASRYAKTEAVAFINANPGQTDLPPELKKKLILADPESLPWVQSYQRTQTAEFTKQTPEEISKIEQAVYNAGPKAAEKIDELTHYRVLRDPAFTQHLMTISRANDERGLFSDPLFTSGKQEILTLSTADPYTGKVGADLASAQEAATQFSKDFINFRLANPNATASDINAKQRELIAIYSDAARTASQKGEGVSARMSFYEAQHKARVDYFKARQTILDNEHKSLQRAIDAAGRKGARE